MLDRKLYQIIVQMLGEKFFTAYVDHFSNKLITQKSLYMLTKRENSHIILPYRWTFYLHGPYSSEIAHMIYYMNDFLPKLQGSQNLLTREEQGEIEQCKLFLQEIEDKLRNSLNKGEIYEILATYLYLQKDIGENSDLIFQKISKLKPTIFEKLRLEDKGQVSAAVLRFSPLE